MYHRRELMEFIQKRMTNLELFYIKQKPIHHKNLFNVDIQCQLACAFTVQQKVVLPLITVLSLTCIEMV